MSLMSRWFGSEDPELKPDWKVLNELEQIAQIEQDSFHKPVVIFKHSLTCGISSMAYHKLDDEWDFNKEDLDFYYLDLLNNRQISNQIASHFKIVHQSPQILVIKNGIAVFDTSHHLVNVSSIKKGLAM